MPLSKNFERALAAVQRMQRGDPKVTAAEVRTAMNVEAALIRRREREDEDGGRERDELPPYDA